MNRILFSSIAFAVFAVALFSQFDNLTSTETNHARSAKVSLGLPDLDTCFDSNPDPVQQEGESTSDYNFRRQQWKNSIRSCMNDHPPRSSDGYEAPSGGPVKENGGWKDSDGRIWKPWDPSQPHNPHWDRQNSGGGYTNVYPSPEIPKQSGSTLLSLNKKDKGREMLSGKVFLRTYGDKDGKTICLYGDPEGLRSFAKKLEELADINQEALEKNRLPSGEGFHTHLSVEMGLMPGSLSVDLGRLDARETKETKWFTSE